MALGRQWVSKAGRGSAQPWDPSEYPVLSPTSWGGDITAFFLGGWGGPVPEHLGWPTGLGKRQTPWGPWSSALTHTPASAHLRAGHQPPSGALLGWSLSPMAPRAQGGTSFSAGTSAWPHGPDTPRYSLGAVGGGLGWAPCDDRYVGAWGDPQGWGSQVWGRSGAPASARAAQELECTCVFIALMCLPCGPWVLSNPYGAFVFVFPENSKVCQVNAVCVGLVLGRRDPRGAPVTASPG